MTAQTTLLPSASGSTPHAWDSPATMVIPRPCVSVASDRWTGRSGLWSRTATRIAWRCSVTVRSMVVPA
jgi:hypothetical protein